MILQEAIPESFIWLSDCDEDGGGDDGDGDGDGSCFGQLQYWENLNFLAWD